MNDFFYKKLDAYKIAKNSQYTCILFLKSILPQSNMPYATNLEELLFLFRQTLLKEWGEWLLRNGFTFWKLPMLL